MESIASGVHDGDGGLDPLGQRRGVNDGRDFGGGVGREVQFVVDQWGGGGGRKAEEAGVGASAERDDLFWSGG